MSSIFVTLTVSILLVFESLGDQFPESMHIYARCKLPFHSVTTWPSRGCAVLCCAVFSAHAAAHTATTTLTCSPACTSDPYCSARHSWVNNNRHGLEVSARSRWGGLSTVAPRETAHWVRIQTSSVALNSTEPLRRANQLVDPSVRSLNV